MHFLFATLAIGAMFGFAVWFRSFVVTTSIQDVAESLEHDEIHTKFPNEARPMRYGLGIPAVRVYTEHVSILYWRTTWASGTIAETIDILDHRAYAGLLLTFLDRQLTHAGAGPRADPIPFPSEMEEQHAVKILEICSRYAKFEDGVSNQR